MKQIKNYEDESSIELYWNSIIKHGKKVATYKFALAQSLISFAQQGKKTVSLEELAFPYSKNICRHLKFYPRQCTSRTSKFLDACTSFNNGRISEEQLIYETVKRGFDNVIDAFHVLDNASCRVEFYEKTYSESFKRIILRDEIFVLINTVDVEILNDTIEEEWKKTEERWDRRDFQG